MPLCTRVVEIDEDGNEEALSLHWSWSTYCRFLDLAEEQGILPELKHDGRAVLVRDAELEDLEMRDTVKHDGDKTYLGVEVAHSTLHKLKAGTRLEMWRT